MTDVLQILPPPFAWCNIPAGQVAIAGAVYDVMPFEIAKYPITNAQFKTFINADDGYDAPFWWQFSLEAKAWRQDDHYLATFGREIGDDEYPCVNVCWYEAIAFCRWLDARLLNSADGTEAIT
jgi:formylglycine-generating enzyme required for sulfatase activity